MEEDTAPALPPPLPAAEKEAVAATTTVSDCAPSAASIPTATITATPIAAPAPESTFLSARQESRLLELLDRTYEVNGRELPPLLVKASALVGALRERIVAKGVGISDVCLNGSAASYIVSERPRAEASDLYNDLDFQFILETPADQRAVHVMFETIRSAFFDCLLEALRLQHQHSIKAGEDTFFLHGYVQKMFKVPSKFADDSGAQDVWSLITLNCDKDRNLEFKFVLKLRRGYEFSIDSLQISLLNHLRSATAAQGLGKPVVHAPPPPLPALAPGLIPSQPQPLPLAALEPQSPSLSPSSAHSPTAALSLTHSLPQHLPLPAAASASLGSASAAAAATVPAASPVNDAAAIGVAAVPLHPPRTDVLSASAMEFLPRKSISLPSSPGSAEPPSSASSNSVQLHDFLLSSPSTSNSSVVLSAATSAAFIAASNAPPRIHSDPAASPSALRDKGVAAPLAVVAVSGYDMAAAATETMATAAGTTTTTTTTTATITTATATATATSSLIPAAEISTPTAIAATSSFSSYTSSSSSSSQPVASIHSVTNENDVIVANGLSVEASSADASTTASVVRVPSPRRSNSAPGSPTRPATSVSPSIIFSSADETGASTTDVQSAPQNFTLISAYGDVREVLDHIQQRKIVTRNPELIRGGGLLKYCYLRAQGYEPAYPEPELRKLELYMCNRFLIDFSNHMAIYTVVYNYFVLRLRRVPNISLMALEELAQIVARSQVTERAAFLAIISSVMTLPAMAREPALPFSVPASPGAGVGAGGMGGGGGGKGSGPEFSLESITSVSSPALPLSHGRSFPTQMVRLPPPPSLAGMDIASAPNLRFPPPHTYPLPPPPLPPSGRSSSTASPTISSPSFGSHASSISPSLPGPPAYHAPPPFHRRHSPPHILHPPHSSHTSTAPNPHTMVATNAVTTSTSSTTTTSSSPSTATATSASTSSTTSASSVSHASNPAAHSHLPPSSLSHSHLLGSSSSSFSSAYPQNAHPSHGSPSRHYSSHGYSHAHSHSHSHSHPHSHSHNQPPPPPPPSSSSSSSASSTTASHSHTSAHSSHSRPSSGSQRSPSTAYPPSANASSSPSSTTMPPPPLFSSSASSSFMPTSSSSSSSPSSTSSTSMHNPSTAHPAPFSSSNPPSPTRPASHQPVPPPAPVAPAAPPPPGPGVSTTASAAARVWGARNFAEVAALPARSSNPPGPRPPPPSSSSSSSSTASSVSTGASADTLSPPSHPRSSRARERDRDGGGTGGERDDKERSLPSSGPGARSLSAPNSPNRSKSRQKHGGGRQGHGRHGSGASEGSFPGSRREGRGGGGSGGGGGGKA